MFYILGIFSKTGKKLGSHIGSKWWPGDTDVKDDPNDPLTRWPSDPVPCLAYIISLFPETLWTFWWNPFCCILNGSKDMVLKKCATFWATFRPTDCAQKFQSTLNRYSVFNLRSSSTVKHDVNQSLYETSNNNELMLFCLANWRKKCKLANIGNIAFLRPALTTGVVMWPVKKKSLTQTT